MTRRLKYEVLEERVVLSASTPVAEMVVAAPATPSAFEAEPQPVAALPIDQWVHSLLYWQFDQLLPEHIPYLTTQQIASIPEIDWFSQIRPESRAALSAQQVQALSVPDLTLIGLTPQQVSWLSVTQIRSLTLFDFKFLSATQVPHLTPAQIATIPDPGPFAEWSPASRAALTTAQIQALKVGTVRLTMLTPQQVSWLTAAQIQTLTKHDFQYLSPVQTPLLTPAQIATIPDPGPFAEWSAASRAALTAPQVQALRVATVRLTMLTPTQVSWLTAAQIQTLTLHDFQYLSPVQTPLLTPAQIATIPDPGPFDAWSAASRAALTAPQVRALRVATVRLTMLTPQQVSWLTAAQIQTLTKHDFQYLSPVQTPLLTPAQIATIPDPGPFAEWSAASRAALTAPQVQALRVATVRLTMLTPTQVSWLLRSQIQVLHRHDFKHLAPFQVRMLSPTQVASISDPGPLAEWTAAARAALMATHVRALTVKTGHLGLLTTQQVGWLTPAQVRSLTLQDFKYLPPSQTPLLTPAQIATIPDPGPFSEWSPTSRAALTFEQVQALRVSTVRLNLLSAQQVGWLSSSQIASLTWEDIRYLSAAQIQHVTPAQFALIPDAGFLKAFSDDVELQFSRAQLLALSVEVMADYAPTALLSPTNYVPTVDIPVINGMPMSHQLHLESERVLNLVPLAAATHRTVSSGNWTDPNTWQNRRVPTLGAKVVISEGDVVRFDAYQVPNSAIETLRVDGTLTFSTTTNTQLAVDTMVVTSTGKLHVGTAAAPIAADVTARIVIADGGPIDTAWDPYQLSRGVISHGEVRMYGKYVTPYVAIAEPLPRGSTQLRLSSVPVNWKVGDEIVLTGTQQHLQGNQTERLIIRAINGSTVVVDPLQFDHVPPAGFGLSLYVANFSRNIELVAADSSVIAERPHLMFLHNPNVIVENVNVTGFGRTNKDVPVTDPVVVNGVLQPGTGLNVRARYAMHFHHTGVNPAYAPAIVRGSIINGSPGWGYVNHSSNVIMENNVAFEAFGAGFSAEDGNEIGVMRNNLSMNSYGSGERIQSREFIHDFGHGGHGFWFQGPGVAVIDNIAAGNGDAAFAYFTNTTKTLFDAVNLDDPSLAAGHKAVPVGTVPLKRFTGNTAMTSRNGLEIWFHQTHMNDGQTVIDDFTAWNLRFTGIDLRYVARTTIRDALLVGDMGVFRGYGVNSNHITGDITFENLHVEGFEVGLLAPPLRRNVIDGGTFNNVTNIEITGAHDTIRSLEIDADLTYRTATSAQLGFRPQLAISVSGPIDFPRRSLEAVLAPDDIRLMRNSSTVAQLYFFEQWYSYIPFPAEDAQGHAPDEYLGLTNLELLLRFGVCLGGGLPAYDVAFTPGILALIDVTPGS